MKKVLSLLLICIMAVSITACNIETEEKPITLTDVDIAYIDIVYDNIENWEFTVSDSGQHWNIDKIAFFDFDGTNKLCFYTLWPITDIYGKGYFINSELMEGMDFSIYDTDEKTRNSGWLAQTRYNGVNWDCEASDEEKYATLKSAYLQYLEREQND